MVVVKVRKDDGLDLRVLETDQLRHRTRVHPLEGFQSLGAAAQQDPVHHALGFILAQCLDHDGAYIVFRPHTQCCLLLNGLGKIFQHPADLLARHIGHGGHSRPDFLHLFRPHVLQDLGGIVLAEGQQQHRCALGTAEFRAVNHLRPPSS